VLRKRWTVLSVLVLLLMALPQSVCLADIGILNGDFSGSTTLPPVYWQLDYPPGNDAVYDNSVFHAAAPSVATPGSEAFSYSQCVNTADWSGPVEVGGWTYMSGGYDEGEGYLRFFVYDDADCEGTEQLVSLSRTDWVPLTFWEEMSGVITFPSAPRLTMLSMKVVIYSVGMNNGVRFDDIYATSSPTAVSLAGIAAQGGGVWAALLVLVAAGASAYGWVRRRRG